MLSFVCRCCGSRREERSPENPNVCVYCSSFDWSDSAEPACVTLNTLQCRQAGLKQVPTELEHFLEIDGATVMECFNAVEQAKQAIAGMAAESASPVKTSDNGAKTVGGQRVSGFATTG